MLKRIHNSIRSLRYGSLLSVVLFFALVSFAHAEVVEAVVDGALKTLGNILYPLAHMLGSVIVGLGGLALNMAIQELIIGWGSIYLGNFGTNIQQIWVIIRDLFNILFIFSFIFLGIKTILNAEDSSTRRAIGHLIVAALFINFSLFIALAVIDFSNVIATQIYNQLIYVGVQNEAGSAQGDISGAFMEAASIGSFFANPPDGTDGATILFYAIFMLIFFIVTGIIFLFGTYHVMYRFVVLSLCLILSPVLFLGMILPNFKKFSDKWIETLLRQSFFAPAFLFLLYVSLQVLMTLKSNFGGVSGVGFTTILQGKDMSPDAFTVFLMFGLTIGFLYAAVKVGDTMGIAGAKTTLGALGKAQKMGRQFVGNATFGTLAGLGRVTFGRDAHIISQDRELQERASRGGMRGFVARRQLEAARIVGDASFDVRKVGNVGNRLGIGDGGTGGFKTRSESRNEKIKKKEREFAESLGTIDDDDPQVAVYIEQRRAYEDNLKGLQNERKNQEKIISNLKRENPQGSRAITENEEKIEAAEEALKKAEEEIERTEKEIKAATEIIGLEKSRRQIGSYVDPAKAAVTKDAFAANKSKISELRKEYDTKEITKDRQLEIAKEIVKLNKKQKDLAYEAKEREGTLGYAGVLEKRGFLASALLGRLASQNHEVGKAIRKQFEKSSLKEVSEKK